MKDLSTKTLAAIISMCSVLIMLVWGYFEGSFTHSWLAVLAGGIAITIISMVRKDKENKDNK